MVEIDNTTIKMTRSDTLLVTITLTKDGASYTPTEGDSIRFIVKTPKMTAGSKQYKDETPLIEKSIDMESMLLELEPSDTTNLDFGTYVYDLEMTYENGQVDTFINNASLVIVPEVD